MHRRKINYTTTTTTLVSYVSNTSKTLKKLVMLLSSQHAQPNISPQGKPEIIEFYNAAKGGVDTFDQMCSVNSCSRKTRRWPLVSFMAVVPNLGSTDPQGVRGMV